MFKTLITKLLRLVLMLWLAFKRRCVYEKGVTSNFLKLNTVWVAYGIGSTEAGSSSTWSDLLPGPAVCSFGFFPCLVSRAPLSLRFLRRLKNKSSMLRKFLFKRILSIPIPKSSAKNTRKTNSKRRNRIIFSPPDEILQAARER